MKKIDKLNMIKYTLVFLLVCYIVILLRRTGNTTTPFETLETSVTENIRMEGMRKANSQEIKRFYQLNAEDFEEIVLYYAEDSMGVDEVLLVQSSQKEKIEQAEKAVEKRLETQKINFDGYGTNQTMLLSHRVIVKRGNILLFVVSPDAEHCKKEFINKL